MRSAFVLSLILWTSSTFGLSFSKQFYAFYDGNQDVDIQHEIKAQQYHYIFVSGFLNERAPFYWGDMIYELKQLGVPEDDITVISPSSKQTVLENSPIICNQIREIASDKPFILFAHSKGAVESFDCTWKNPELVKEKFKALYFIQGSFGGSYIADHLVDGNLQMDDKLPLGRRTKIWIQFSLESKLLKSNIRALRTLSTETARNWMQEITSSKNSLQASVENKFFYITSYSQPHENSFYLTNPGHYLTTYHGENDGLVNTNKQFVHGIGRVLVSLPADHVGFIAPRPISAVGAKFRYSFVRAVIENLIHPSIYHEYN